MSRKYNFSKRSDINRFKRDITRDLERQYISAVKSGYSKCPVCGHHLNVHIGTTICPSCGFKLTVR